LWEKISKIVSDKSDSGVCELNIIGAQVKSDETNFYSASILRE